ncbi:hypothetical protein N7G274_009945 [Stereocaulon virgatum]|uniref:Uncharacterized protein n=1 Tax=Stereocaulon virgatum TaxID=373712 RepID=A0ABR3ZWF2_9LECA
MDPQGASQPNLDTAYEHPSNPAQSSSEQAASQSKGASLQRSDPTLARRKPNDQINEGGNDESEATPSSLGYGARDASGDAGESMGEPVSSLEGEQMRAPGDGDVAVAQAKKHGSGEQGDLAADLDRKKADQARIKEKRGTGGGSGGVDIEGAVGGAEKGFVGGGNEGPDSQGGSIQSSHEYV